MSNGDRLVDAWIALQRAGSDSEAADKLFWAYEEVYDLLAADPIGAFNFILEVLARDNADKIVNNLAAGPLEDLLTGHGKEMIGRIEEEAARNQTFRLLLKGVWGRNRMDPGVWERLIAVRGAPQ